MWFECPRVKTIRSGSDYSFPEHRGMIAGSEMSRQP